MRSGLELCVLTCWLAGCSGSAPNASPGGASGAAQGGTSGTAAGGAGTSGNAGMSGNAGATYCNTIVNIAPTIQETYGFDFPPAPIGGAISDGTYVETSYVNYLADSDPPPAPVHKLTATISGTTFQAVYLDEMGIEQRITLELQARGTMLTEQVSCRTNSPVMTGQLNTQGYDATPTTFSIHLLKDDVSAFTPVYTLTKQ